MGNGCDAMRCDAKKSAMEWCELGLGWRKREKKEEKLTDKSRPFHYPLRKFMCQRGEIVKNVERMRAN